MWSALKKGRGLATEQQRGMKCWTWKLACSILLKCLTNMHMRLGGLVYLMLTYDSVDGVLCLFSVREILSKIHSTHLIFDAMQTPNKRLRNARGESTNMLGVCCYWINFKTYLIAGCVLFFFFYCFIENFVLLFHWKSENVERKKTIDALSTIFKCKRCLHFKHTICSLTGYLITPNKYNII